MTTYTRKRPQVCVTLSQESADILDKLAPRNKGSFIDECISAYLSGDHYMFVTAKHGLMMIKGITDMPIYWAETVDGDFRSEDFNTIGQVMNWLAKECPELKLDR
jgi:hypothetical protein